jgi:acetyl-CoA C-acetyltransferase
MSGESAYIIAARRSALGRVGGLHARRRVEELTAPVIAAALKDARLEPAVVEEVILGNAAAGDNVARLVALAGGLPETVPAMTIDRSGSSGLDAILGAARLISLGERDIVVAGGAESFSTAPWRIVKPRTVHQLPRFLPLQDPAGEGAGEDANTSTLDSAETVAEELQLSRATLDGFALRSRVRGFLAHEAKRFVGEIVPMKVSAEEARDQSLDGDITLEDLADLPPLRENGGRLTAASVSRPHDGAAVAIVVSSGVWASLGKPPALKVVAGRACGVSPAKEPLAAFEASRQLLARLNGSRPKALTAVEASEATAAEPIALRDGLGLEDDALNPDGGSLGLGSPGAAGSAVLVARLFSRLVRMRRADTPSHGLAVHGARGGLAVALLVEAK